MKNKKKISRGEVTEKVVEKWFRESVEGLNGLCIKWLPFTLGGLPDRIVLLPGARIFFVELKRIKDGTPTEATPLQQHWHRKLRALGFEVFVIYDKVTIEGFVIHVLTKK